LRLTILVEDGGGGQLLIARFQSTGKDEAGREWHFPRYGAEVTPGIVADIIRPGRAAGWQPETPGRPPFELDGEPFLRLPADPTQPPPGSEDDRKRLFLSALREQIEVIYSAPTTSDASRSGIGPDSSRQDPRV
jgi:hypothetical protein